MRRKKWLLYSLIFFIFLFTFGWYQRLDENFLELSTCPACYGEGLCPALLEMGSSRSKRITLTGFSSWKISKLLNVKNVYYGMSGSFPVVLKKLAHDSELYDFSKKLCFINREKENCDVSQAIKSILIRNDNNIAQIVNRYPQLFEMSEGVKCNHNHTLYHLYQKYIKLDTGPYRQHHFLTLLAVNMEPLILNAYQGGWFPQIYGMCGRTFVEEFVGPTLATLGQSPWIIRADYARQLLEIAHEFSNGKYRLYLTDVSLDNFAVDDNGRIKIIDAENIVMVDPMINGLDQSEHVNEGFGCWNCLSFSYEDLCGHVFTDHNYFAICKGLLSSQSFSRDLPEGLLHSPPEWVRQQHPALSSLVEDCARSDPLITTLPRRREAVAALYTLLLEILRGSRDDV